MSLTNIITHTTHALIYYDSIDKFWIMSGDISRLDHVWGGKCLYRGPGTVI